MPQVTVTWKPKTQVMGDYRFVRSTDGDTPFIELPVRMLSIDAPETHFEGKPVDHEPRLVKLRERLKNNAFPALPTELRDHLTNRLDGEAGRRQYVQGLMAAAFFEELLKKDLRPPNRHERSILVITSGERMDRNGRLLAYLTRNLSPAELRKTPRSKRKTFNLQMVGAGWAAPMPIFPSLPAKADMQMLCDAAREAKNERRGIWGDDKTLLAYEYRMCLKMERGLPELEYLPRYCADLTTGQLYKPRDYLKVAPENRLFVWRDQKAEAIAQLGLAEVS